MRCGPKPCLHRSSFALCFHLHGSLYSWHNTRFLCSQEQNSSVTRVAYSPGSCHWWITLSRTLWPLTVLIPSLLRGLVASFLAEWTVLPTLSFVLSAYSPQGRGLSLVQTPSTACREESAYSQPHSGHSGWPFKHVVCLCSHLPLSVPTAPLSLFQETKTPSCYSGSCFCPQFTPQT